MSAKRPLRGVCYFYSETGTEGGHWAFQDRKYISPKGWSYKGLHILKDGDRLIIFSLDKPAQIVWSGKIFLHQYPVFTEHAWGFWIRADQKNVDRVTWAKYFFHEYPAELIPARKP